MNGKQSNKKKGGVPLAFVKFVSGTASEFAVAQKDNNTLYFITDEKRIYKGSVPYAGGIYLTVTDYPSTGDVNTIYINTTDGSVKFWNGSAYITMVKPSATVINGGGLNSELVTSKAVVDYVTSAIQDQDLSEITNRLSTIENQIIVINGTSDGSIKKALADAKSYADSKVQTLEDGQVTTNKNNIASLQTSVAGKADKATTLAGYGISDAYTKAQTDSAITTAIANADHLKREIVDALPQISSADEHTIYMVPKSGGTGSQKYDEYMLINGAFEKIGDSSVDLTNYATKTEVGTAKAEAIAAAGTNADSKIANKIGEIGSSTVKKYVDDSNSTTLASAKSYADTLGTNYATAAQGTKADSALQVADITTGTVNGTIGVKNTNVAVKGLGSAAYVATTAFDPSGSSASALNSAKSYADTQDTTTLNSAKSYTDAALTWGSL